MSLYPNTTDYQLVTLFSDQVQDILVQKFIDNPMLDRLLTVDVGIKAKTEVPTILDDNGIMMGAAQNCNPTSETLVIGSEPVYYEPVQMGYFYDVCETQFPKFWDLFKADGNDRTNMLEMRAWSLFVDYIEKKHMRELFRKVWFDDTDMASIASGGTLNNSFSVSKFNQIDGLFKQIFTQGTANPDQIVTIAANTASGQVLTPAAANTVMEDLVLKAPLNLNNNSIYVTESIGRAHLSYLRNVTVNNSFDRKFISDREYQFAGYSVIMLPFWDYIIANYFTASGVKDKPHRAVMTSPANIRLATETEATLGDYRQWFSEDQQVVKIKSAFSMDAKIPFLGDFAAAY